MHSVLSLIKKKVCANKKFVVINTAVKIWWIVIWNLGPVEEYTLLSNCRSIWPDHEIRIYHCSGICIVTLSVVRNVRPTFKESISQQFKDVWSWEQHFENKNNVISLQACKRKTIIAAEGDTISHKPNHEELLLCCDPPWLHFSNGIVRTMITCQQTICSSTFDSNSESQM